MQLVQRVPREAHPAQQQQRACAIRAILHRDLDRAFLAHYVVQDLIAQAAAQLAAHVLPTPTVALVPVLAQVCHAFLHMIQL